MASNRLNYGRKLLLGQQAMREAAANERKRQYEARVAQLQAAKNANAAAKKHALSVIQQKKAEIKAVYNMNSAALNTEISRLRTINSAAAGAGNFYRVYRKNLNKKYEKNNNYKNNTRYKNNKARAFYAVYKKYKGGMNKRNNISLKSRFRRGLANVRYGAQTGAASLKAGFAAIRPSGASILALRPWRTRSNIVQQMINETKAAATKN